MLHFKTVQTDFGKNQKGSIAIIFGLALFGICMFLGLSVDCGRAFTAREKATDALDAAALAAAKDLMTGTMTDAQITSVAKDFFQRNVALTPSYGEKYSNIRVNIDRVADTITVAVDTRVPTTFARIARFDAFNFTASSQATFGVTDLELGLVLDTTGSMGDPSNSGTGARKIDELKVAAGQLFDMLLPDAGVAGSVRIGIAPFSASVNAGAYATTVTGGKSKGCVVERSGLDAYTDADPVVAADYINPGSKKLGDIDPTEGFGSFACEGAPVLPLTGDKASLKAEVNGFQPADSTAGHIGTAWGWYLISPKWNKVWPAASIPAAYGTKNLVKSIVVMTDGTYNIAYYNGQTAAQQAIKLCNNAKAQGVVVYTIGFTSPASSEATLKACASIDARTGLPSFYKAESQADLSAAFADIATKLTALRLDK